MSAIDSGPYSRLHCIYFRKEMNMIGQLFHSGMHRGVKI